MILYKNKQISLRFLLFVVRTTCFLHKLTDLCWEQVVPFENRVILNTNWMFYLQIIDFSGRIKLSSREFHDSHWESFILCVFMSLRNFSSIISKSWTDVLEILLVAQRLKKPILVKRDLAQALVRLKWPQYLPNRLLSIFRMIPLAPAIVIAVFTSPPHSLNLTKYCCTFSSICSLSKRGHPCFAESSLLIAGQFFSCSSFSS